MTVIFQSLMSGRLGVQGALNRPRTLNPLRPNNDDLCSGAGNAVNSAVSSKLERQLKVRLSLISYICCITR